MGPVHRQITRTISIKYQTICCRTLEILICCFILLPVLVFGAQTQRQHAWKKCWQNCLAEHVGRFLCQPSLPAMLAPALAKGFCAHVAWSVKHSMALSIYIYIYIYIIYSYLPVQNGRSRATPPERQASCFHFGNHHSPRPRRRSFVIGHSILRIGGVCLHVRNLLSTWDAAAISSAWEEFVSR